MAQSRLVARVVFCLAVLLIPVARARAAVETPLHRELFKAYYYDFVQRNPEAFVRHRVAIVAPEHLRTLRASDSTNAALDRVLRALPQAEISVGVPSVANLSLSFDMNNLRGLRDLAARTALGLGLAPKEVTDTQYRRYMDTHHLEVSATADALYDLLRDGRQTITSAVFTPDQVALLRAEFEDNMAADPLLKSPNSDFGALLASAPASFDRMMQAVDRTKTREELQAIRGDVAAFQQFVREKFARVPTDAELRDLFAGVAAELQDVRQFVTEQRDVQVRLKQSQEMHAAVDLLGTLLGTLDPRTGRQFATLAHQTIIAAEAVAGLTTALTLTGVGTVVAAAVVVAQLMSDSGPSEQQQLQAFILEIYRDIMRELADVKRGLFEIRVQLAAIDSRLTDILIDSRIGFSGLQLALQSTAATLGSLALESAQFAQADTIQPASTARTAIVDLMTNPAQEENRSRLIADPAGVQGAQTQQNLATIAHLGLVASKTIPFSQPLQRFEDETLSAARLEAVENRVGDLPALADLLRAHGAMPRVNQFDAVAHPIALAQSVAWYVDARDRLPLPSAPDANFGQLCRETRHVAAAATASRNLTPFALRFVARAAEEFLLIARPAVEANPPIDAELLSQPVLPPLPAESGARIDEALAANAGFTQFWVIAQPTGIVQRLGTGADLPLPDGRSVEGEEIAVLEGCAIAELVVFAKGPRITTDALGIRQFSEARRLIVRDRRQICGREHPIVGFPVAAFGPALERVVEAVALSLPQVTLSARDNTLNEAGLRQIADFLVRRRAKALASRAREHGVITVEPPRRVDHLFIEREPQPGRLGPVVVTRIHGCVEWVVEGKWTPVTRAVGTTIGDGPVWTHTSRRACLPPEGFINSHQVDELANRLRDDAAAEIELPSATLAADLQRLEEVHRNVQSGRAQEVRKAWQTNAANRQHPVARAISNLRLARYALDTFAQFGFGICSNTPQELRASLLLVTCGDAPTCGGNDAPDRRVKQTIEYPELLALMGTVEKMTAFRDFAQRLQTALENRDSAICPDGAPFGVAEAAAILNGIARRSDRFLPEGCRF